MPLPLALRLTALRAIFLSVARRCGSVNRNTAYTRYRQQARGRWRGTGGRTRYHYYGGGR